MTLLLFYKQEVAAAPVTSSGVRRLDAYLAGVAAEVRRRRAPKVWPDFNEWFDQANRRIEALSAPPETVTVRVEAAVEYPLPLVPELLSTITADVSKKLLAQIIFIEGEIAAAEEVQEARRRRDEEDFLMLIFFG